jgi:hypothetical protein
MEVADLASIDGRVSQILVSKVRPLQRSGPIHAAELVSPGETSKSGYVDLSNVSSLHYTFFDDRGVSGPFPF